MDKYINVSVVVPVYNPSIKTLETFISRANGFLDRHPDCEVVLSDDGSGIKIFNKNNNFVLLSNEHSGKWGAIKKGFRVTRGRKIFLLDVDLSVGFDEVERYMYTSGNILGNRYLDDDTKYPLIRRIFSRAFYLTRWLLVGVKYEDSQCPFKGLIKTIKLIRAMDKITEEGFVGDVELLILLKNLKFKEVPVKYIYGQDGNFKVLKSSWRMFKGLLRLRRRYF